MHVFLVFAMLFAPAFSHEKPEDKQRRLEAVRLRLTVEGDGVMAVAREDVAKELVISPKQREQINELFLRWASARHPYREKGWTSARTLREQYPNNGASRQEIESAEAGAAAERKEWEIASQEVPVAIKAVLTAEQQQKLLILRQPELERMPLPKDLPEAVMAYLSVDGNTLAIEEAEQVTIVHLDSETRFVLKWSDMTDPDNPLSRPWQMRFTPDGKEIVVAWAKRPTGVHRSSQITHWNPANGKLIREYAKAIEQLPALWVDLQRLDGTQSISEEAKSWDPSDRRLLQNDLTYGLDKWGFSPDGKWIANRPRGAGLQLRHMATGKLKWEVEMPPLEMPGYGLYTQCLAFSPDSTEVAFVTSDDNAFSVFDVPSGTLQHTLAVPGEKLKKVCYSADGKRIAACTSEAVVVWDRDSGRELGMYLLSQKEMSGMSLVLPQLSGDGSRLLVNIMGTFINGHRYDVRLLKVPSPSND